MRDLWDEDLMTFLAEANKNKVEMLLVGGGAVNFHGYQRHSADIDFWINMKAENLDLLILTLRNCGFEIDSFPNNVISSLQNISLKFSPAGATVELITNFILTKSFSEALRDSEEMVINHNRILKCKTLSFEDLIESKKRASRPKDLLDIQELERRKGKSV